MNHGGLTFGVIGGDGGEEPTIHVDPYARLVLPPRLIAGRAHATPGGPLEKHVRFFTFPNRPRPVTCKWDTELKTLLRPI